MLSRRLFLLTVTSATGALQSAGTPNPVGCQTNAWQSPPEDFEAFLGVLGRIHRLGFDGFETNVRYLQGRADDLRDVRERIVKTGLRFLGSHTNMRGEPKDIEQRIAISAAAGAERIVLSGEGLQESGQLDETRLAAKAEHLNRLGAQCQRHRLRLAYHNHQGEFLAGSREIEELLKRTNPQNVSLMLDAGHAFLAGVDVPAFFRRHHERLDGLHVRDVKNGKQVPLGQGDFPQAALATAIREAGWKGWLVVEEELRTSDFAHADAVVEADRKFVREVFGA